jgi:Fe-S-cluster containining protein
VKRKRAKTRAAAAATRIRDDAGRVHLALVRDPSSGRVGVVLEAAVFKEAWQNELAEGAANTAYAMLGRGPSVAGAVALGRQAMEATSRVVEGLLARAPEPGVACRAGCDHCCYQPVGVTPPEALVIHQHLKSTRSAADLAAVSARVATARARARGLSAAERFSPEHPCPFLDGGACSIYEVRPLSCRGMNSLDAGECASRLREPEARAAFLAQGAGGRLFLEPIRAAHAVSAGLQLGLEELCALDMSPLDLTAVMDLLLSGPPTLSDAWVGCGTPFAAARGADLTAAPGVADHIGAATSRSPAQ